MTIQTKLHLRSLAEILMAVAAVLLQFGMGLGQIAGHDQALPKALRRDGTRREKEKYQDMGKETHSVEMHRDHMQKRSRDQHDEKRQMKQVP